MSKTQIYIRYKISDREQYVEITREEFKKFGSGEKIDLKNGTCNIIPSKNSFMYNQIKVYIEPIRFPSEVMSQDYGFTELYSKMDAVYLTFDELYDCIEGNKISEITREKLDAIRENIQSNDCMWE